MPRSDDAAAVRHVLAKYAAKYTLRIKPEQDAVPVHEYLVDVVLSSDDDLLEHIEQTDELHNTSAAEFLVAVLNNVPF
jgi:6-pyruvoyl-tetrahydropterin synthase